MESCPKCGSKLSLIGGKGSRHYECESIFYFDGSRFISVACRDETIAALAEENAKLKEEVAILESEVVRRDARIADMKSNPMPNDLVSREAVMAAIKVRLRFHQDCLDKLRMRERCDESHVFHTEGLVDGIESTLGIIAALPAAGDERSAAKHVCDNRCLGEEGHHAWPSPPPQEAGDEPGK